MPGLLAAGELLALALPLDGLEVRPTLPSKDDLSVV
jgi:hypothetical protein